VKFIDLQLSKPILRAAADEGYHTATPIQAQAIPPALEGRDVLGCAQTGTGKTAAFAMPVLQRLSAGPKPAGSRRRPRCLVLCPTRELAVQISASFDTYGRHLPLRSTVVFGGVSQVAQVRALRRGVDVLVATPGRLLDLIQQGHIHLGEIQTLVLDEADRMLDMGFLADIRRVLEKVPPRRQTMFFSATMPQDIRKLADQLLHKPAKVQVSPQSSAIDTVDQSVYFVPRRNKSDLLAHFVKSQDVTRALVFTRTKHGADRLVHQLHDQGLEAEAIHSNKTQFARQKSLENFRAGRVLLLVATDIASRGIDVEGISHVFNYDLTHEPETYVHRIGRTGRAGASGVAVSFCDDDERGHLEAIQRLLRSKIRVRTNQPTYTRKPADTKHKPSPPRTNSTSSTSSSKGRRRRATGPAKRTRSTQARRRSAARASA
jgi:ATP-dependent RNA helicase RhlE